MRPRDHSQPHHLSTSTPAASPAAPAPVSAKHELPLLRLEARRRARLHRRRRRRLRPDSSAATDDPPAPELFQVSFETNVVLDGAAAEPMVLEVNRSWAPIGADRFYALVNDRYYDDAAFFRVVPSFVVQWGIAALPEETKKWFGFN